MPVRTKELARGQFAQQTAVTLYTCPAGRTAIVKDVAVVATGTSPVSLRVKRGGVSLVVWSGANSVTGATDLRGVWVVLEPGDELEAIRAGSAQSYDVTISGTELDGVAD